MGTGNLVEEHYDVLACLGGPQTPIRVAVLTELYSNGSMRKSELKKTFVKEGSGGSEGWEFDVSEPTLYRQFEEEDETNASLVERGWVEDVSEGRNAESRYDITPQGRVVCEKLRSLFELFDLLESVPQELGPFLEVATRADVEVDEEVLRELTEAEIYTKEPTDLNRPTLKGTQFMSEYDHHRGLSWITSEEYVDYYRMFLEDQEKEVEYVLTPEVLEGAVENYAERWREILETGRMTVYENDVSPLGMTVVDGGVAWGYFEPPTGNHEAVLISESDIVRDWALGVFEDYKQKARNVTEEQLEKTRGIRTP